MNVDFFGLFDYETADGDTYEYTASEFNEILKAITGNGVMKDKDNELAVSVNGLDVSVNTGVAFINGRIAQINSAKALTVDATTTDRMDRVILKLDVPNRVITLEVKQGTSATTPTLTQTTNVYEISLAKIFVPANSVETVLTDERTFTYNPSQAVALMNSILSGTEYVYAVYA